MNFDPKNINWKIVATVLAAIGYVAYRNKGFKQLNKAFAKNATVAAVLAVVTYFGYDFVMNMISKKGLPGNGNGNETALGGYHDLPPQMGHYDPIDSRQGLDVADSRTQRVQPYQPGMAGYSRQQHPVGVAGASWPNQSLGC